jgi:antitoxin ParD1/3/4
MPKNTSITLGDHFHGFVEKQVGSGRFASASEVVRAGLRLLEEQEMKLQALREALTLGEESGPPRPFDRQAFLRRMHTGPDMDG